MEEYTLWHALKKSDNVCFELRRRVMPYGRSG